MTQRPHYKGGGGYGSQAEDSNPGTQEVEGTEGVLPGCKIFKGILLGGPHNGLNNLLRLVMICTVLHRRDGGAGFAFNSYRLIVKLLVGR